MAFATRTGTHRNLDGLRAARWGLLVSAAGVWRTEGFTKWVGDNGAWSDFKKGEPFNEDRFVRFILYVEAQVRAGNPPLWIVIPDIVMGGEASLDLSVRWLRKLRRRRGLRGVRFMLAVQNGMEAGKMLGRVKRIVCPRVGIFIGGGTEWKLAHLKLWRRISRERGALVHCARVNTARRIRACAAAGVDSFDGSSPSIWGKTLRPLELARQQNDIEGYIARIAA